MNLNSTSQKKCTQDKITKLFRKPQCREEILGKKKTKEFIGLQTQYSSFIQ